ncbi:MAG: hypothetical protein Q8O14_02495 [bacterium]|jgi:hypothetical protein|nr:hypothetical protein [bacterium]
MTIRCVMDLLLRPGLGMTHAAALRDRLAASPADALPALVEDHPVLLLALLRRAGSWPRAGRDLPQDAREACQILGEEAVRSHLRTTLLILPSPAGQAAADQRARILREAGERLLRLLEEARTTEATPPGRVERTLLRLLELPVRLADPAIAPANPPAQWGRRLLEVMGGQRWYNPEIIQALAAMEDPVAVGGAAGRRGALLRAVADLGVPGGLSDPGLALHLGLMPWQLPDLGMGKQRG